MPLKITKADEPIPPQPNPRNNLSIKVHCDACGNLFWPRRNTASGANRFCSRKCKGK